MIQFLNSLMDKPLMLAARNSDVLKHCSNPCQWVSKCQASTKLPTSQFLSVTLISEKTCTPTSLWAVEPLCSQEFPRGSARKSLPLPPPPWRWRFWPPRKESSWSGLEVLSFHHSQPSRTCGSPRPNIKKPEPPLSTENASDQRIPIYLIILHKVEISSHFLIQIIKRLKLIWTSLLIIDLFIYWVINERELKREWPPVQAAQNILGRIPNNSAYKVLDADGFKNFQHEAINMLASYILRSTSESIQPSRRPAYL